MSSKSVLSVMLHEILYIINIILNIMTQEIEEYRGELGIQGLSEKTIKAYMWSVNSFMKFVKKPLEKLTKIDIRKYRSSLHELKPSSVARHFHALRSFFDYYDRGDLKKAIGKLPTVHRDLHPYLLEEDIFKLYNSADNLKDKLLVMLGYSCALRVSEATSIIRGDINWRWTKFYVFRKKKGEGPQKVEVLVDDDTLSLMREYINIYPSTSIYLFPGSKRNSGVDLPMNPATAEYRLKQLCRIADVKTQVSRLPPEQIGYHILRHSRGANMRLQGMSIDDIADFLGHEDIQTTRIYTKIINEDLRKRIIFPKWNG